MHKGEHMPHSAQPQDAWTRPDHRQDGPSPSAAVPEMRPATPAFMARRRHDVLARTVADDIVPRLLLARGVAPVVAGPGGTPGGHEVEALVDIVLRQELTDAVAFVGAVGARGIAVEAIYLDLLAPVARRLGTMWEEDLCDFGRVTIGLGRLHQVLGGLSMPFQDDPRRRDRRPRVLLVPAPGDTHSFGMSMVASFFQRAGWSGWSGVPESPADLQRIVGGDAFAVVGFSASCGRKLDALSAAIRAVRRASMNRDVRIMVGGPVFIEHPDLVAMVGADATASDGRQAVLQAQNLLTLIPSRS